MEEAIIQAGDYLRLTKTWTLPYNTHKSRKKPISWARAAAEGQPFSFTRSFIKALINTSQTHKLCSPHNTKSGQWLQTKPGADSQALQSCTLHCRIPFIGHPGRGKENIVTRQAQLTGYQSLELGRIRIRELGVREGHGQITLSLLNFIYSCIWGGRGCTCRDQRKGSRSHLLFFYYLLVEKFTLAHSVS